MKLLQRYVLVEFLRTFALSFATVVGIVIIVNFIVLLHRHGLQLRHAAMLIPIAVPYTLTYVIPISVLSAAVITYSRLAHEQELDAMSVCGVHLRVVIMPVLVLCVTFAGFCVWLNHTVSPWCVRQQAVFLKNALQDLIVLKLSLGQKQVEIGNYRLLIHRVSDGVFYGVTFVDFDEEQRPRAIVSARQCRLNYDPRHAELQLEFEGASGYALDYEPGGTVLRKAVGERFLRSFDLKHLSAAEKRLPAFTYEDLERRALELRYLTDVDARGDEELAADAARYGASGALPTPLEQAAATAVADGIRQEQGYRERREQAGEQARELKRLESFTTLDADQTEYREHLQASLKAFDADDRRRTWQQRRLRQEASKVEAEYHLRFALGFAPLALALIGVPMGILVRHPNRIVAFFYGSAPVFGAYYPLMMSGAAIAAKGGLPALPAVWSGNVVLTAGGIWLLRKVYSR